MVKTEPKIQPETSKAMTSSASAMAAGKKKKYKGVRMRSWGSWVSEIRAPHQKTRIWLGSYSTPEAAARAYDAALLCLKGSSANFNFPITSSHYIPDTVMSPKSIQRVAAAAAAAANSFPVDNINNNNNNDNATSPAPPVSSPSLPSSSSSSSSSVSSPPYDYQLVDDDVSLIQSIWTNNNDLPVSELDCSWFDFDALQLQPLDQMFNPPPTMIDDFYYEGGDDFRLWSFAE